MKNIDRKAIKRTKPNYGLLFFCSFLALLFSWLIEKRITLPTQITSVFLVIGLFVLFFATIKRVELVFYILVAYLPFNKILTGDFGEFMQAVNLTNILILLVLIGWFIKSANKGVKIYTKTSLDSSILLFCLLGIFSLTKGAYFLGSNYFLDFVVPLKRWLTPVFLFFLGSNVIRTRKQFKNVIIIMMVVVTVAGLMAIYEYLDIGSAASGSLENARVGGIAEQANMLGAFFIYYMFIFAGFILMNLKKIKYWLLSIPFYICYMGIRVTFSRGAFIAFGFACLALAFFKNKILFFFTLAFLIMAILNPILLPAGIRYRMGMTFGDNAAYSFNAEDVVDPSAQQRLTIWKGAMQMIKDHPFGVGYGIFPYLIPHYAPIYLNMDAHNTYIIIAAEMGIITLIVFLWVIAMIFKNCFWLYKRVKDKFIKAFSLGMLAGIAGFLMVNMFGSRMDSEEVSSYFWIIAGMIMAAVRMRRRGEIV